MAATAGSCRRFLLRGGVALDVVVRLHPAQHALDAGEQLARIEGLGDVVVGADLEADDAVDDVARGRDHDDADVVALAQEARQRQAVLAGHADVEQDEVGQIALDLGAHRGAAVGGANVVAVAAQVLHQHRPNARVVVDDEKASAAVHARSPSCGGTTRATRYKTITRDALRAASPIPALSTLSPRCRAWGPATNDQGNRHERFFLPGQRQPLRQGHRSLQARALGDRARRHPRPPLRLRPHLPARRPLAGRRARVPHAGAAPDAEPGAGADLRQPVRPGRALHRRQDARGRPRARARRPDRVRGARPLHRRGAQAPGAVSPHRGDARRRHAARLRLRRRAERGRPGGALQVAPGRCSG